MEEKSTQFKVNPNYAFHIYVEDRRKIEIVKYYCEDKAAAEFKAHQISWMGVSLQDRNCIIAAGNIWRVTWIKI